MDTLSHQHSELIERAKEFATLRHADQRRKYTDEPYIVHCHEVVALVAMHLNDFDPELLAACWLHDILEDTNTTIQEIQELFGDNVAGLVTDVTCVSIGTRRERHKKEMARLATISPRAKTLKLANIISNCTTIIERDAKFAKTYLQEKYKILDALLGGDAYLHAIAYRLVCDGIEALKRPKK